MTAGKSWRWFNNRMGIPEFIFCVLYGTVLQFVVENTIGVDIHGMGAMYCTVGFLTDFFYRLFKD